MRIRSSVAAFGALLLVTFAGAAPSLASSHREAPFITKNPKVDGTDFYMFNSYESGRSNFVTLIANFQPLQDAYGGPNYFSMDPDALYEIHVDNNNNGEEDITFQFRFSNTLANAGNGVQLPLQFGDGGVKNVSIPLVIAGPVNGTDPNLGAGTPGNINVAETYSVKVVRGARRTGMAQDVTIVSPGSGSTFTKPLDNVGGKTFGGGYDQYANQYKYDVSIPGCTVDAATQGRIFVGQRREGFAVNIGTIFDLVNAPLGVIADDNLKDALNPGTGPNAEPSNIGPLDGKNVTTIAVEVPKSCLTQGTQTILGGWMSASVRQARVINPNATYSRPAREGGAWAQVSRLGHPLVNEVVIGLKDKDRFNSSHPSGDGQFIDYVTHPTLAKLVELIYGAANAPAPTVERQDLVTVFLKGVPNVNENGAVAEYLRLNTAIPATAAAGQNYLGAMGCFTGRSATEGPHLDTALPSCDPAGFPNGRRPGDDVVDIALRAMMGVLLPGNVAGAGGVPLHDAVQQRSAQFDDTFPYLRSPAGGTSSNN
ncbi:MAG: DUF4331 domain-containing protein [Polyangiaceae bacterium]